MIARRGNDIRIGVVAYHAGIGHGALLAAGGLLGDGPVVVEVDLVVGHSGLVLGEAQVSQTVGVVPDEPAGELKHQGEDVVEQRQELGLVYAGHVGLVFGEGQLCRGDVGRRIHLGLAHGDAIIVDVGGIGGAHGRRENQGDLKIVRHQGELDLPIGGIVIVAEVEGVLRVHEEAHVVVAVFGIVVTVQGLALEPLVDFVLGSCGGGHRQHPNEQRRDQQQGQNARFHFLRLLSDCICQSFPPDHAPGETNEHLSKLYIKKERKARRIRNYSQFAISRTNRIRMVATAARVAVPCGEIFVVEVPLMIPFPTAQAIASVA